MRTVVTSDMVAHLWANQSQEHARNAGNSMSFEGPTIYSYRTPIARMLGGVVLVTSETFSMTTSSKHMPKLWRALSRGVEIYRVPVIHPAPYASFDHARNLAHLVKVYRDMVGTLRRQLSTDHTAGDAEIYLTGYADDVRGYHARFCADSPAPAIDLVADAEMIAAAHAKRAERRADPRYGERTLKAREAREASKARKLQAAREAEAIRQAGNIERWRAGEYVYGSLYAIPPMLRVSPSNPDTVQTSHGAEVPLAAAEILFSVVARCRRLGKGFLVRESVDSDRIQIGSFTVREIKANGDIVVGCHEIAWPEIARFAISQGWTVGPFPEYVPGGGL